MQDQQPPIEFDPNEPHEEPTMGEELKDMFRRFLSRLRIRLLFYLRRGLPPATKERRAEVQMQLRESSTPDFDYFVLVLLSCMIATLGLLIDSSATIIGAMLVAPLMSPILGLGLASIRGDAKLFRNAALALGQGAFIAIILSTIITWFNRILPIVTLSELPAEVLARTRPSPIDLGIALAGGLAATFALVQPNLSAALPGVAIATALMPPLCVVGVGIAQGNRQVAGGAFLLFLTNAITIAAASMVLFYLMGFSAPRQEGEKGLPRSLRVSLVLTLILLAPLGWQSYNFVRQANLNREVQVVVEGEVVEVTDFGVFVRIGPMDGLVHVSQIIDDFITYDTKRGALIGKESQRVLEKGVSVRSRIITVSLTGGASRGSKIGMTMRQPFLGALPWVENDVKKARGETPAPAVKDEKKV